MNVECVFILTCYTRIRNAQTVQRELVYCFNRRATSKTIYKNVNKCKCFETSVNLNNGKSGRTRTVRTLENIEMVRRRLIQNPRNTWLRRNGVGISKSLFQRITKQELLFHPYRIKVRHQLQENNFWCWLAFCRWFQNQCNNPDFIPHLVIGYEAGFVMNGNVNTRNIIEHASKGTAFRLSLE